MKKLNLENCARLTKGEVALKFDRENDSVEDLRKILKHCFPADKSADKSALSGSAEYYFKAHNDGHWDFKYSVVPKMIKLPLSDFFQPAQTKYGVSGVFLSEQEYNELIEFKNKYQEILKVIKG